jgi:hypothetical protein
MNYSVIDQALWKLTVDSGDSREAWPLVVLNDARYCKCVFIVL